VVIDEHDELLHEERSPTWNAVDVARQRAQLAKVPLIVTSPVPSAESLHHFTDSVTIARTTQQWPAIEIVDLGEVPVAGSLLSSQLLAAVSNEKMSVACVLNTKGKSRLIVCRSCREVQLCPQCRSLLAQDDDVLVCLRCGDEHGAVCLTCGRTSFLVPRGGMGQLAGQIRASVGRDVVEVSGESDENLGDGSIYVGTEAVLHRVTRVDVVVFADIDRDLGAPRVTAAREVLALVTRAARVVGDRGTIIIQTRLTEHPVIAALASDEPFDALLRWCESDLQQRHVFSLPPFSQLVRVNVRAPHSVDEVPELDGIDIARHNDNVILKSTDRTALEAGIQTLRQLFGTHIAVYCDPVRY
jgi:primosomal protein N' (replication factor Y)